MHLSLLPSLYSEKTPPDYARRIESDRYRRVLYHLFSAGTSSPLVRCGLQPRILLSRRGPQRFPHCSQEYQPLFRWEGIWEGVWVQLLGHG